MQARAPVETHSRSKIACTVWSRVANGVSRPLMRIHEGGKGGIECERSDYDLGVLRSSILSSIGGGFTINVGPTVLIKRTVVQSNVLRPHIHPNVHTPTMAIIPLQSSAITCKIPFMASLISCSFALHHAHPVVQTSHARTCPKTSITRRYLMSSHTHRTCADRSCKACQLPCGHRGAASHSCT